jgi:hypothetical protein
MNRPLVFQSDGFTGVTPEAVKSTVCQSLPDTAASVRFCRASVGLGGRLLLYRFDAPKSDLHLHARTEFDSHWDRPPVTVTPNQPSPFTSRNVAFIRESFGVDASWMLPPDDAIGTVYKSADGQYSHRPSIFVDETHDTLYFVMMD